MPFPRHFVPFRFSFRSVIHFALIGGMTQDMHPSSHLGYGYPVAPAPFLVKSALSPVDCLCTL